MTPLRVLDLFSGIGGFSLGLERTGGFKTVAFCEIENFPRRVLAKHWPEVPCYDDVRTLTADRLRADGIAVDVICGGFPCQDLSNAGHGDGLAGARSGLWAEYARLVSELRPAFIIVENVESLLHRGLDAVLGYLASIGYDAEWHCLPASAIGADHVRDRLWIIAYPSLAGLSSGVSSREDHEDAFPVSARLGPILASASPIPGDYRAHKPVLDRGSYGLSGRVDRIKALGNAVVPQIPELIGNAILASLVQQEAA